MAACNICPKNLDSPVCLPCGHIFCDDCIQRAIRAIAPFTTFHQCPVCQTPYSTGYIDPTTVPPPLRPNVLPSVRKLHMSSVSSTPIRQGVSGSGDNHDLLVENARLRVENGALQKNCAMWRKRAEAHSSSTLGLLHMVRMARDQAICVAHERDELRKRCDALQRILSHQRQHDDEDGDDHFDIQQETDNDSEPFLPSNMLEEVNKFQDESPASRALSPGSDYSQESPSRGTPKDQNYRKRRRLPNSADADTGIMRENKRTRRSSPSLSPLSFPTHNA